MNKPRFSNLLNFLWRVLTVFALVGILALGGWLRLIGLDWDQSQHLHPDERFLTMVESAISPVQTPGEYFDTANSSLNPHNRGHGYFVYGTLPIFMVRYAAEGLNPLGAWARSAAASLPDGHWQKAPLEAFGKVENWAGYDEVTLVGRALSALMDLGAVFLLFLTALRLYGRRVALLAAAFSALAVMQIQQSHFFTVDNFATFFMTLAFFFAVQIAASREYFLSARPGKPWAVRLLLDSTFWNSIFFGLATGMAIASKLNAAPVAVLLLFALWIHHARTRPVDQTPRQRDDAITALAGLLVLGAFFTILAFRIFQPYAFSGPGFFGLSPNPLWVQNIVEQRNQAAGDVDFPPALQWANRPLTYSIENLIRWGLGWPLGLTALAGLLFMFWRFWRGEWRDHFLLLSWTSFYLLWQSFEWNPTMRYQLPVYPLLALMAAWFIVNGPRITNYKLRVANFAYAILAISVLASAFAWAYAFTRIYTREHTRVQATRWIFKNIPGALNLIAENEAGQAVLPLSYPENYILQPGAPFSTQFIASGGNLTEILLTRAVDTANGGPQTVTVLLASDPSFAEETIAVRGQIRADFAPRGDGRGQPVRIPLEEPYPLDPLRTYHLRLESTGSLSVTGSALVSETSWDDGLPLRMDGYDPFGGLYQGDLNFEMYWDDDAAKLERFYSNLDNGDYIIITSNRQWGTTTRLPVRYPLTTTFYRALLGCPEGQDILWCYSAAQPGQFQGQLGFELVEVFESYPTLVAGDFTWQANTQLADEAFTVYDHPKVLVFQKQAAYSPAAVRQVLGAVDLYRAVHLTPRRASIFPDGSTPKPCFGFAALCRFFGAPEAAEIILQNLPVSARHSFGMLLSDENRLVQQSGGAWSGMFSYESVHNRFPAVGLVFWYLFLAVLGFIMFPILRLALPGLADSGYPLGRFAGLVLLGWMSWFWALVGGVYTRASIATALGLIFALSLLAAWLQRETLWREIRSRGRYFLLVEGIFLAFFLLDLIIRLANPDLWHPARGGERPMDFSYLNAVLRSTTFPPYDPWFAGGYINYYYYGFVLVGTPIKLLGIVPSIAYNFLLPSLFAMLALGGFSVAWNLAAGIQRSPARRVDFRLIAGLAASAGLVLLGNLGTVRLVYQALQKMAVGNEQFEAIGINIFQRWAWAAQGLLKNVTGSPLAVGWGEWYWNPSRVIPPGPGNEITEFPLFTFIYSDLHAHMIAFPLSVLALAWGLSTLQARGLAPWRWLASLVFGGLVIGALRPTNTWDFPTFLLFASLVTAYAFFRFVELGQTRRWGISPLRQRVLLSLAAAGALAAFALLFYQPYAEWFGLGYSKLNVWDNVKTPIWSYLTHWGIFLFFITFWLNWETRQWMAQTPVSALAKLRPYLWLIVLSAVALVIAVIVLMLKFEVETAWVSLPLAAWALALILRPGQPEAKRFVLFMVGTAMFITIFVELFTLSGDLGRMNTVFKFYLQAWVLLALSAAAGTAWLLSEFDQWHETWRNVYLFGASILLFCGLLFLTTGGYDKMRDRIAENIPFTFDGMEYMRHSTYWDKEDMDLSQDYNAIRWLQDNVEGSPVIVEGYTSEYRWGARNVIYTGLSGVLGWNWHQRQQRSNLTPENWVFDRADQINEFYDTTDLLLARAFLKKYSVRYIIVGQMEYNYYAPEGLAKFESQDGTLWREVFRDRQTVIYEVLP